MRRIFAFIALLAGLLAAAPAWAAVTLSFHSFNGSMFGGRYPHAFIVMAGTLDSTGQAVNENYGYTAVTAGPSVLMGKVRGTINVEQPRYIATTNRHFTMTITDAQYHAIVAEVATWRDGPAQKRYSLDHHNCVHFIARIAQMVGFDLPVPQKLVRKPRAYLNLLVKTYPALNGRLFD